MKPAHALLILSFLLTAVPQAAGFQQPAPRASFPVKYLAEGVVYLDGGRNAGLAEGQKLTVSRTDASGGATRVVAELEVISVASSSAACAVRTSTADVAVGDEAVLSPADTAALVKQQSADEAGKYAQVISFTEGDPLEEEVRAEIPKPKLPEVNRMRGRIGFEYSTVRDQSTPRETSSVGLVLRVDATRLNGTYWNLSGYYRGRLTMQNRDAQQKTLTDLIQRTYHLSLSHNDPASAWVAGVGRLYLPYATSLGTVDGGYFGRRLGKHVTTGLFGGSSPDPTSWNYDPQRQLLGGFLNFEGGGFESFRYSATAGVASGRIRWKPDRDFGFFESSLLYKRSLSLYYNLEADMVHNADGTGRRELVPARSYVTLRYQPHPLITFDLNHNYFREIPTFDERLLSTGLVDKLLFEGLSAGVRLDLPYRISPYASFGRSNKTGDARTAWNQMYGLTVTNPLHSGLRTDVRYSKFDSSFGRGIYRSASLSRTVGGLFRFEVQAGQQNYTAQRGVQNRAWWTSFNADWILRKHYFIGGGAMLYSAPGQGYTQYQVNVSYGF